MRYEKECQQDSHNNCEGQQPSKQPVRVQSGWWRKQEIQGNTEWQGTDQHEWVASSPFGLKAIGELTDHGIRNGINEECQQ